MTEIDIKYQNGKIYNIICNETGEVYFGSTIMPLDIRIGSHKSAFKSWKTKKTTHYCKTFDIIDRGNYSYNLVELFPCNSQDELFKREGYYQLNFPCINKVIAGGKNEKSFKSNICHSCEVCKFETNKKSTIDSHNTSKTHLNKIKQNICQPIIPEINMEQKYNEMKQKNEELELKYKELENQHIIDNEKIQDMEHKLKGIEYGLILKDEFIEFIKDYYKHQINLINQARIFTCDGCIKKCDGCIKKCDGCI
jgi:hypothetical protein